MTNASDQTAFDFNVTRIGNTSGKEYLAVFHAEKIGISSPATGDSIAAVYGSDLDGSFSRPTDESDKIVGPAGSGSKFLASNGGGNPILLQRPNVSHSADWVLYYISVADVSMALLDGINTNIWRDYLHVAQILDIESIHNTTWYSWAKSGGSFTWATFTGGSLVNRDYDPWPALTWRPEGSGFSHTGKLVASLDGAYNQPLETQGVIGNISYDSSDENPYLLTIEGDVFQKQEFMLKRRMYRHTTSGHEDDYPEYWYQPTGFGTTWMTKVAYSPAHSKWIGLGLCSGTEGPDICYAFGSNLDDLASASLTGLGLDEVFDDYDNGGVMEQFGISKEPNGHLRTESGSFRLYVTERVYPGGLDGLFGITMYSVPVSCS